MTVCLSHFLSLLPVRTSCPDLLPAGSTVGLCVGLCVVGRGSAIVIRAEYEAYFERCKKV